MPLSIEQINKLLHQLVRCITILRNCEFLIGDKVIKDKLHEQTQLLSDMHRTLLESVQNHD